MGKCGKSDPLSTWVFAEIAFPIFYNFHAKILHSSARWVKNELIGQCWISLYSSASRQDDLAISRGLYWNIRDTSYTQYIYNCWVSWPGLHRHSSAWQFLPTALAGKAKQSVASVCPFVCFHSIFWNKWPLNLSLCVQGRGVMTI